MLKYIKCLYCKFVMRIEGKKEACEYCGHDLKGNSEEVTEREWREYWIGVKGQPFEWNALKGSKQKSILEVRK